MLGIQGAVASIRSINFDRGTAAERRDAAAAIHAALRSLQPDARVALPLTEPDRFICELAGVTATDVQKPHLIYRAGVSVAANMSGQMGELVRAFAAVGVEHERAQADAVRCYKDATARGDTAARLRAARDVARHFVARCGCAGGLVASTATGGGLKAAEEADRLAKTLGIVVLDDNGGRAHSRSSNNGNSPAPGWTNGALRRNGAPTALWPGYELERDGLSVTYLATVSGRRISKTKYLDAWDAWEAAQHWIRERLEKGLL